MKWRWSYTVSYCVCTVVLGLFLIPQSTSATTFPRLANYFLRWDIRAGDVAGLAQYDVLVLDIETQYKTPDRLREIKRLNPDIVMLAYVTPQEIMKTAIVSDSTFRRSLASGIRSDWYVTSPSGSRLSYWTGTYLLNVANTSDSGWPAYLVDTMLTTMEPFGDVWDGIFYDNAWEGITWFTSDIDLDRNGARDPDPDTAWRRGMEYIYRTTRERAPDDFIIIGNGHTGGYNAQLNGKLIEQFQTHDWARTMQVYRENILRGESPQYTIVNVNTLNTGRQSDYQLMRFGLTSSLLEDGYYSFDFGDTNHGQIWWYDEYDVDLGDAISAAQSNTDGTSYTPGVWRRDFEHGISVVNSGNNYERIDLGGEFEKIHGSQDVSVNDGAIVEEVILSPEDGIILLKTFEEIQDIIFTNGHFARFFDGSGNRTRNGIFLFTENQPGGVQIGRIDLNRNGKPELIRVRRGKVEVYRDDGLLYSRFFPYGGNYEGELRLAVGDLLGTGFKEIFVAPSDGYPAPIKSYSLFGHQVRDDWYPFGVGYRNGYSMAIGTFNNPIRNHIAVGAGTGQYPSVHIFDYQLQKTDEFLAYEKSFRGGVFVATGDTDGDGIDEIITGPGEGKKPEIRVFSYSGLLASEFLAYSTFLTPGIRVQSADLDFDGKDDIIGLSSGLGL